MPEASLQLRRASAGFRTEQDARVKTRAPHNHCGQRASTETRN